MSYITCKTYGLLILFYTNTIAKRKRFCLTRQKNLHKIGVNIFGTTVFITLEPSPCEDNDTEPDP